MATTETTNFTEILPTGLIGVRLTTTATTDTYVCPYFSTIEAVIANNESDTDGVGVAVSGSTITLTVGTSGDVVTLLASGIP